MLKKLVVCFAVFAISALAAVAHYNVTLYRNCVLAGTELKAGSYKVEVNGDKATLRLDKVSVQASVKVETADKKFDETAVQYSNADGKDRIQEIRVGGTKTRLIFSD